MYRKLITLSYIVFLCIGTGFAQTKPLCFEDNNAIDKNILDGIFLIQVITAPQSFDKTIIGTGFITDSNKITTAKHIFHHGVYQVNIYNRNGQFVGNATPDFDVNAPTPVIAQNQIAQDVGTLTITPNADGSNPLESYTPIAYEPHNFIGAMSVSKPFGIAGGASGAPVLNSYGQAIGVVSAATHNKTTQMVSANYPSILQNYASQDQEFPETSFAFIAPIPWRSTPIEESGTVYIPGYPEGHCVLYEGTLIGVPNISMKIE